MECCSKKSPLHAIFSLIVVALIIGAGVYFWQTQNKDRPCAGSTSCPPSSGEMFYPSPAEEEDTLLTGSFAYSETLYDYYGTLFVRGYPELVEVEEAFCTGACPLHTYVFFHVLETTSPALTDYLTANLGNSFLGEESIGLGCLEEGLIVYSNDSAAYGFKSFSLFPELSEAILNATQEDPIALKLERFMPGAGSGAPTCYSHFAIVELVE